MLDKLIEHVKSQTAYKKVCIFFVAFVTMVNVIGGNHEIFYGSSGTNMAENAYAEENSAAEQEIADSIMLAAKKSPKLEEVSSAPSKTDSDEEDNVKVKSKPEDEEDADSEANAGEATDNKNGLKSDGKRAEKAVSEAEKEEKQTEIEPKGFVYCDKIPMSRELQAYTYKKCEERGIEYELVLAIIWRESNFKINAVHYNTNGTRDNGIMQINDVNRKWLRDDYGITDLMDPYQNIDAGTAMLGRLTSKYGVHNAMLAYQYGEGGMARKLKQGITTSTAIEKAYKQRDYYRKII